MPQLWQSLTQQAGLGIEHVPPQSQHRILTHCATTGSPKSDYWVTHKAAGLEGESEQEKALQLAPPQPVSLYDTSDPMMFDLWLIQVLLRGLRQKMLRESLGYSPRVGCKAMLSFLLWRNSFLKAPKCQDAMKTEQAIMRWKLSDSPSHKVRQVLQQSIIKEMWHTQNWAWADL